MMNVIPEACRAHNLDMYGFFLLIVGYLTLSYTYFMHIQDVIKFNISKMF
jgi:hypothetical protein